MFIVFWSLIKARVFEQGEPRVSDSEPERSEGSVVICEIIWISYAFHMLFIWFSYSIHMVSMAFCESYTKDAQLKNVILQIHISVPFMNFI